MSSPFGPDDLDYVRQNEVLDELETDADRAFQPRPGCCEDCDEALAFAAITAQVAEAVSR